MSTDAVLAFVWNRGAILRGCNDVLIRIALSEQLTRAMFASREEGKLSEPITELHDGSAMQNKIVRAQMQPVPQDELLAYLTDCVPATAALVNISLCLGGGKQH